jgi:hypothetical protein
MEVNVILSILANARSAMRAHWDMPADMQLCCKSPINQKTGQPKKLAAEFPLPPVFGHRVFFEVVSL